MTTFRNNIYIYIYYTYIFTCIEVGVRGQCRYSSPRQVAGVAWDSDIERQVTCTEQQLAAGRLARSSHPGSSPGGKSLPAASSDGSDAAKRRGLTDREGCGSFMIIMVNADSLGQWLFFLNFIQSYRTPMFLRFFCQTRVGSTGIYIGTPE